MAVADNPVETESPADGDQVYAVVGGVPDTFTLSTANMNDVPADALSYLNLIFTLLLPTYELSDTV